MSASHSQLEGDLTFQTLDDIALGIARGRLRPASVLPLLKIGDIGPLIELLLYSRTNGGLISSLDDLQAMRRVRALVDALQAQRRGLPVYLDDQASGRRVGFIATAHKGRSGHPWDDFCLKARAAAEQAGLQDTEARALIGALVEIEENVHLHSERVDDGVVAFAATPQRFELVVADSGIGALRSLRTHPDYAELSDEGTALRLALENGHSRYGRDSGHGLGFNRLFIGLAALKAELRFRSGDHALTIAGTGPRLVAATTTQRPALQGFMASIACSPLQASLLH